MLINQEEGSISVERTRREIKKTFKAAERKGARGQIKDLGGLPEDGALARRT